MSVGTRDDRVVQVSPVLDAPVNAGHLCVKGRYAFDFIDAEDRVSEPMIREDGEWKVVSWEEAIRYTADKLKNIVTENGKETVAVLGRRAQPTKRTTSLKIHARCARHK